MVCSGVAHAEHRRADGVDAQDSWVGSAAPSCSAGAVPIDRSRSTNMVEQMIDQFRQDRLVLDPAGGHAQAHRALESGFYHIALGADVPVVPGYLVTRAKRASLSPAIRLSGNTRGHGPIARLLARRGSRHRAIRQWARSAARGIQRSSLALPARLPRRPDYSARAPNAVLAQLVRNVRRGAASRRAAANTVAVGLLRASTMRCRSKSARPPGGHRSRSPLGRKSTEPSSRGARARCTRPPRPARRADCVAELADVARPAVPSRRARKSAKARGRQARRCRASSMNPRAKVEIRSALAQGGIRTRRRSTDSRGRGGMCAACGSGPHWSPRRSGRR